MSNLLIDEYPLIVLPTLAAKIGLNEAIFLQQLNYWLGSSQHQHDGRKWVYNTFDEWQTQLPFWPVITIKRIVKSLRDSGIIITTSKYNKMPLDRTLWYSIDRDALHRIITTSPSYQNDTTIVSKCYDSKYQNDTSNNQRLLTETTNREGEVARAGVDPMTQPEPPPPAPPTATPSNAKATSEPQPPAKPPLLPNDSYDIPTLNGSSSPSPGSGAPLPEMERTLIVTSKRGRPSAQSLTPHVKGAQFGKDDLVMEETGTNPVAIYYEFYSIYDHKLAARVEDDLARVVTDLDHWREIVRVWQSCGHKPSNVNGMRDWYRDPSRIPGGQPVNGHTNGSSRKEHVNGNGKYSSNGVHSSVAKPAASAADRRQREYNERYTSLLADEINGVIPKDEAAKLWEQIDREFPDFQYREVR